MTHVDWCAPTNQQPTNGIAKGISSIHSQKYKDRKRPLGVLETSGVHTLHGWSLGVLWWALFGWVFRVKNFLDLLTLKLRLQTFESSATIYQSTHLPLQQAWIFGTTLWEPRILQISERWELYWTFPITATDYYSIWKMCGDYRRVAIIWLTGLAFDVKDRHASGEGTVAQEQAFTVRFLPFKVD